MDRFHSDSDKNEVMRPQRLPVGIKRVKRLQNNRKKFKDIVEKCLEEKQKYTDSFNKYSKTLQEATKGYLSVQENFVKFEEAHLKLIKAINHPSIPLISNNVSTPKYHDGLNQQKEDLKKPIADFKLKMLQKMEVVSNMMVLKEKFNQISFLFEELSVDANSITKQAFLKELVDSEDAYKKNLAIFKRKMTETLQYGRNHLDATKQKTQKLLYTQWLYSLNKNLEEIEIKNKELSENWNKESSTQATEQIEISRYIVQEPSNLTAKQNTSMMSGIPAITDPISSLEQSFMCNEDIHGQFITPQKVNDQEGFKERHKKNNEEINVQQNTSMMSGIYVPTNPISPLEQSFICNEDNHGQLNTPYKVNNQEEFKVRHENNNEEVNVQQNWPGRSLPALDDLMTLEESFGMVQRDTAVTSPYFNNDSGQDNQAKPDCRFPLQVFEQDKNIVETIVSQIGPELNSPSPEHDVQDFGTHFLVAETNPTSESQDGFLTNVGLKSKKKRLNSEPESTAHKNSQIIQPDSIKYYTCNFCHEMHESVKLLKSHLSLYHSPKICNVCNFIACDLKKLQLHADIEHRGHKVCFQCASVQEKLNFSIHVSTHKDKGNFNCSECPKTYKTLESLQTHQKKHKNLYYSCDYCEHQSISRFDLQKHKAHHLSDRLKQYVCKVCHAYFEEYPKLLRHLKLCHLMKENKSPDKMTCAICYLEMDDPTKFVNHLKYDHKNNVLVTKTTIDDRSGVSRDKCRLCDMFIKNIKVRIMHMIIIHGVPPYECNCKQKFFTKGLLDFHQLNHTKAEEERFHLKPGRGRKKQAKNEK